MALTCDRVRLSQAKEVRHGASEGKAQHRPCSPWHDGRAGFEHDAHPTSFLALAAVTARRTRALPRHGRRAESKSSQTDRTFRRALLRDVPADVHRIRGGRSRLLLGGRAFRLFASV